MKSSNVNPECMGVTKTPTVETIHKTGNYGAPSWTKSTFCCAGDGLLHRRCFVAPAMWTIDLFVTPAMWTMDVNHVRSKIAGANWLALRLHYGI
jgi:hypothetical protein